MSEFAFEEKERLVKWPIVVLASFMVFLYGLGIYGIIRYLVLNPMALASVGFFLGVIGDLIARNFQTVTYMLIGLVAVTIVAVPTILWTMAKFGKTVMAFVIFAIPVIVAGVGFLTMAMGFFLGALAVAFFGVFFVFIGGGFLFFLYRRRERVYLAGHIFELSAKAVATEKETLVPSLMFGLFSLVNVIMAAASGFLISDLLAPVQNAIVIGVAVFLVELGYAWLLFSIMYLADGTIIGIIDDWYRNPTADKANLKKGVARVSRVAGPVILFGFVMALLSTLARTARKSAGGARRGGNPLGAIGALLLWLVTALAYGLVQFITYFTLPAMVVDGKGFKDSIKRSYALIWRHWVDVIIAYLGIESTYALFMVAMLALYGTAGAAIGWLLIAPTLVTTVPPIFESILTAFAFILFGFIPAYFLFRPLKAAYNTILYEFAKDMETDGQLPSRMPPNLRQQFQFTIAQAQAQPNTMRWAEPKFPETGLGKKIGAEFEEAKQEGLTKYVKGEFLGETKAEVKEIDLMNEFSEHLRRIGIVATLLESGNTDTIEEPCIRIEGKNIDFVQVQSLPGRSGRPSEVSYQYVLRANVKGLEDKLKTEINSPAYWKLDLSEKRIVDFSWVGGELARALNADIDLKNTLLKGGLDRLVIIPDKKNQLVRITHMPGTWTTIAVGAESITIGRKALPNSEDFEAYDKIALHIRRIVSQRP